MFPHLIHHAAVKGFKRSITQGDYMANSESIVNIILRRAALLLFKMRRHIKVNRPFTKLTYYFLPGSTSGLSTTRERQKISIQSGPKPVISGENSGGHPCRQSRPTTEVCGN